MVSLPNGTVVRLRSHHGTYLFAMDDKGSVTQSENGADKGAEWTVEVNASNSIIRLKSCYGLYLTASTENVGFGIKGKKVIQSRSLIASSMEWNKIIHGDRMKFQTESRSCLRAYGGLSLWKNKVAHKVPFWPKIDQDYLWHVDVWEPEAPGPNATPGPDETTAARDMPRPDETTAPRMTIADAKNVAVGVGAVAGTGTAICGIIATKRHLEHHGEEDAANNNAAGDDGY